VGIKLWHEFKCSSFFAFLYHFGTSAFSQAMVWYSQLMQDRMDRVAQSRWLCAKRFIRRLQVRVLPGML
jgi:hypothetical protein